MSGCAKATDVTLDAHMTCLDRKMVSDNNDYTKSKTDRTRRAVTPHKTVAPGNLKHGSELLRQRAFYDEETRLYDEEARNNYKSDNIHEDLSGIKG